MQPTQWPGTPSGLDRMSVQRYLGAAVDEPAGVLARARLAFQFGATVTAAASPARTQPPAGICLAGCLSPIDAPRPDAARAALPPGAAWAAYLPRAGEVADDACGAARWCPGRDPG